ncbi:MAG TPA: hypothetical protein PKY35_03575 [Candidatus Hydrogenedentes bacterium]|nr:hypothetical protein [Candidatus Hydrogenedentota bacterium]HOL76084.1 hypothetical protein [Candidatus Hydrogenedentota bacterium]HPO84698.1 hypothetical protein [Candidatus Hydrogenedentota bacterium]
MKRILRLVLFILISGVGLVPLSEGASVPPEQRDLKKIYWGNPDSFNKPGQVSILDVVRSTPEFKTVEKEKVERGTGRYWILMEQASHRSILAITSFARQSDYDLIARLGYLNGLNPPITADNVTTQVLDHLQQEK